MKRGLITYIAAFLCLQILAPTAVLADFVCSVEVSYQWEKKETEEPEDKRRSMNKEAPAEQPKKVLWKKVSVEDTEEALAKQRVVDKAKEELSPADLECNKLHEDLAGCMAAKFHASRSVLQTLSFKARKELEDAIVQGCKSQEGVCYNAELSEAKCREVVVEEAPAEDAGEDSKEES